MSSSIAALKPDQGRIYFVRENTAIGGAVQPNIVLDKEIVGVSQPGGFFYIDTAPGQHLVSTTTEAENHVTFGLDAGQTKYVRTMVSIGFFVGHVSPVLIEPEQAMEYLKESKYTGKIAVPGQPGKPAVADTHPPATPPAVQPVVQPAYVETVPVVGYSSPAPKTNVESAPMPVAVVQQEVAAPRPQAVEPIAVSNVSNVSYSTPQMSSDTTAASVGNAALATDNGKVTFKLGVSSNTVERMGKQRGCESKLGAGLISTTGPAETYLMSCNDGSTYLAKCELRQCVPM